MKTFLISLLYAMVSSLAIFCCIAVFVLFRTGKLEMSFITAPESAVGLMYGICLYFTGRYSSVLLVRVIPNKVYHLVVYLLLMLIFTPIIIFLINSSIHVLWKGQSLQSFIAGEHWQDYIPITILTTFIGLISLGFYYYKEYKNKQIAQQKLIAGGATAQLESLKNQIDPHFFFNSLNVLIGLIEEDQKNAVCYTKALSGIYRYILEHKDQEYVSVQEELNFAKDYVSLLQLRFEDSIGYETSVEDKNMTKKIVPLSLQLLLENCIKHNKISQESPLKIKIYQEHGMLVVENNSQEKASPSGSTQIGLRNIQERYHLTSNRDIQVTKTLEKFIVKLPML